ncbi:MAG: LytTR family DNA-binding domain-containing protein [Salibacteraceae bacterium]
MLIGLAVHLDKETEHWMLRLCEDSGLFASVKAFSHVGDAIREIRSTAVDAVFYDPEDMGSGPGFSLLEANTSVPTVLVTKNPHLALKAYEYRNVVDYLVHPLDTSRVEESLDRIISAKEEGVPSNKKVETRPLDYIFVNVNKRLVRIDLDDIQYLASKGDYITIHTQKERFTTHGTLKSLVPKLGHRFADVHRSYLVNLDHVVDITADSVQVGDAAIPVSRLKRKKLLENILCL